MKNKDKEKILIKHNHTLDSFFTKNTDCSKPTLKKGKLKIKVPPSSGLPPTCNPTDVVLVSQLLYSDILSTHNSDSINKKLSSIACAWIL